MVRPIELRGRAHNDEDEREPESRECYPAPPSPIEGEEEEGGQDKAGDFRRIDFEPLTSA